MIFQNSSSLPTHFQVILPASSHLSHYHKTYNIDPITAAEYNCLHYWYSFLIWYITLITHLTFLSLDCQEASMSRLHCIKTPNCQVKWGLKCVWKGHGYSFLEFSSLPLLMNDFMLSLSYKGWTIRSVLFFFLLLLLPRYQGHDQHGTYTNLTYYQVLIIDEVSEQW